MANCMIVADEIYDGLDFTGEHVSVASLSQDVPVFALNGVSKVYYAQDGGLVTWQFMTQQMFWSMSETA